MSGTSPHWVSFKDSVVHLLYVSGYFALIALMAIIFDLAGHRLLPWLGVTTFVGVGLTWAAEVLFAADLLLLGAYVARYLWEKLWSL